LSRTGVPGWETGTTAVSQPGQINVFVVVVAIDLEHVAAGGRRRCGDGRGGDDAIPWPHGDLICWSRTC